ncbi:unnamed protein product [Phyllotreta striolata]|uniref:ABC transporter domain-containing protein n=1 Tax=Phyllotreta striolata TaxID=444603 RepID=A0A9N9XQK2_PHYSR|nr:unnamed protein product [Phyllotreta striolata]
MEETPLIDFRSSRDHQKELELSSTSTESYSKWSSAVEEGITLAWDNLSVYTKTSRYQKRIINGVSGAVKAGSLVAIMGSSGAGKSTLMSALAHHTMGDTFVEGTILINGRPIGDYMKFLSGFMHQEDIFVPYLTVREHMTIMANLKLDRRISSNEKQRLINDILSQLGLLNSIDTRIGGGDIEKSLSGGEKKRLAFATELLTDPQVLFCDEPTTGLDSYSARKLVGMMSEMATARKTILCTIHQPSSDVFSMFNQLILIADGRTAFVGPTYAALEFFEQLGYLCPSSYSPADFYIKTLSMMPGCEEDGGRTAKRICDQFVVSDYAKEVEIVVRYEIHLNRNLIENKFEIRKDFRAVVWPVRVFWLTRRWFLELIRNPSLESTKLFQRLFIGLIVGFCYFGTDGLTQKGIQSVEGIIFMFVTENTFNPMYNVLAHFPSYLPLFLREYKSGLYHPFTYYISRILSLIPSFLLEPIIFVVSAYWLSGLRSAASTFTATLLVVILTMNVSSACGIMFSNAFDSVPAALAYLVPFDYVHMITAGVFIRLSTLPNVIAWVKYLSWLMYSTEALNILQWKGIVNIGCENQPEGVPCIQNGTQILEMYSFSEENLWKDVSGMLILLISFYALGYFFLWRKIRRY